MPNLYVAMYQPTEGNYEHWALYLENGPEHTIYEIVGEWPSFRPNVKLARPSNTNRHKRSILVYSIGLSDIVAFQGAVASVRLDNLASEWNCQDYVIECLDKLEEGCIIDGNDEEYIKAKEQVKEYFGPL
ncbi:MAG: hypothetical protein M1834_003852 [Cirrosporium novae-zelandiae]|nr:MAG: hypothetical protein M1834_003852 [Cirrosporium novae-zelandiae]